MREIKNRLCLEGNQGRLQPKFSRFATPLPTSRTDGNVARHGFTPVGEMERHRASRICSVVDKKNMRVLYVRNQTISDAENTFGNFRFSCLSTHTISVACRSYGPHQLHETCAKAMHFVINECHDRATACEWRILWS